MLDIALLLLVLMTASLVIIGFVRARVTQDTAQTASLQELRVKRAALDTSRFLGASDELAKLSAASICQLYGDRTLTERLIRGLIASRAAVAIYGVGCFYQPGMFDRRTPLYGPYVHWRNGHIVADINTDWSYPYPTSTWYQAGVAAHGRVQVRGPYMEMGHSYISTVQAFYRQGRLAGVVSVDALTPDLTAILAADLQRGDQLIIDARSGREIMRVGALGHGPNRVVHTPINGTKAILYLRSESRALVARTRQVWAEGLAGIVILWAFGTLVGSLILRFRAMRRSAQGLRAEIAVRDAVEQRLREAAYTDALTGLPNRLLFIERLTEALSSAPGGTEYAVLFADLDRFNLINDTLGHSSGDELLRRIGTRLCEMLPQAACIARLGGDEFAVLVRAGQSAALRQALLLLDIVRLPIVLRDRDVYVTASTGLVMIEASYRHAEEVLRDADIAMYEAKSRGRNTYALFDTVMRRTIERNSQLGHDLRRAIELRQFVAYYQPIMDLRSERIASFEALARWERDGVCSNAGDFIPYAESHGLVGEIDELIFGAVCGDLNREHTHGLPVAVNISAANLTGPDIVGRLRENLARYDLLPQQIRLEVTETAIMSNADRSLETLVQLRDAGIEIVVDDFGTGHSSLAYLQRLPIAGVKIDRSFVESIESDTASLAIVRSIVALAEALGIYTVAEGIETREQQEILRRLGVHYGQGFFFSQAVPALHATALCAASARAQAQ